MNKSDAVFLDIDGTILKEDFTLSLRMIQAIANLREQGTIICPATGRSWEALESIYKKAGMNGPAICYNGAAVIRNGDVLFEVHMEESAARRIIQEAEALRKVSIIAYQNTQLIHGKSDFRIEAYRIRTGLEGREVDWNTMDVSNLTKMMALGEPAELQTLKTLMESSFDSDKLSLTYSNPRFLEFMGGHVDKARGFKFVCDFLNIEAAQTTALGDGWNDFEILKSAGNGWVMAGGPKEMIEQFPPERRAGHVNEDGAAVVLESMLNA